MAPECIIQFGVYRTLPLQLDYSILLRMCRHDSGNQQPNKVNGARSTNEHEAKFPSGTEPPRQREEGRRAGWVRTAYSDELN